MAQQPPNFPPRPPNFAGPPAPIPSPRPSNADDGSPAYLRVLRHPVVLGISGVVLVMLVVAIVLVIMGSDGDSGATQSDGAGRPTAEVTQTPVELRGILGRTRTSATVRSGPGTGYAVLGVLQRGAEVDVVGRSDDGEWLQAFYPPGSQLHGWIEADLLDVEGDPTTLAIGEANPGPNVYVPTEPFVAEEPVDEAPTEVIEEPTEPEPTEPPTDTPPPLPTDTPPALPTATAPPPTVTPAGP